MKNIHDKMAARGVEALDDAELLTLLTEDGQAARALLGAYEGSPARIAGESDARLRRATTWCGCSGRSCNASPTRSAGWFISLRRTASSSVSA